MVFVFYSNVLRAIDNDKPTVSSLVQIDVAIAIPDVQVGCIGGHSGHLLCALLDKCNDVQPLCNCYC